MVVSPRWRREKPRLVLSASDLSLARGYAGTAAGTRPSPNQLGGQVEWESGNKRTIVCLTSPSREASYDPGARRVPPQDKEGLL
jgi:hypothetical protein